MRMRVSFPLLVVCISLAVNSVVPAVHANVRSVDVVVPAAGWIDARGVEFRTTLAISNPSEDERVDIALQFLVTGARNDEPRSVAVTLAPRETAMYHDTAGALFGANGLAGAIRIRATREVHVSARIHTPLDREGAREHVRVFEPVAPRSGLAAGQSGTVHGLRAGSGVQYELTLFETAGAGAIVHATAFDARGEAIGAGTFALAAYERQIVAAEVLVGVAEVTEGSIRIRVEGDGRVAANGSMIQDRERDVADFALTIDDAGTAAPRGTLIPPAAFEDDAHPLLPLQRELAPATPAASFTATASAAGRPRTVTTTADKFIGMAQLMSAPQNALLYAKSTGNAAYLFRGGVDSAYVPGAPGVSITETDQFAVRTDGGFVAKSQNTAIVGAAASIPATGAGTRFMWFPYKAAFRAGTVIPQFPTVWDEASTGSYSMAFGKNVTASGYGSFAFGEQVAVSSTVGAAFGNNISVPGTAAFAAGASHVASGFAATAMGYTNNALGQGSVALGYRVNSCANYSVALGYRASTSSAPVYGGDACAGTKYTGVFVWGDASVSNTFLAATANDQFSIRASGGVRLRTNPTLTTGCDLAAGGAVWQCSSDRNVKMNFAKLDGEEILAKLERMPIESWSFITERNVRHIGPTAQDFHAAFGLGSDDRAIGHTDINGIALIGVQTLERRTRELRDQLAARTNELAAAQSEIDDLRARVERLEALLMRK